jgi:predicted acylesterase/phospholipase RssA
MADKELRLALVLNGGVSLAVWIGGVMHEIDRLRRRDGYEDWLTDYDSVRVDVIAGASAGGINGALLAAAIQGGKDLRAPGNLPLRDLWVQLGDLRRLTRSPREQDPPSLLKGDELMVGEIEDVLRSLLAERAASPLGHPLHLYITSTDMSAGRWRTFATTEQPIHEPDHRVVFRFSAGDGDDDSGVPGDLPATVLADQLPLQLDQANRLARAARASSSFPGAFPPHEAKIWRDGDVETHYLVDGGILDNQPFDPVLNRISLMAVDQPVDRVVLYVVPYVTARRPPAVPGAVPGLVATIGASGLARDLPKLESLERISRERQDGQSAQAAARIARARICDLISAAPALFGTYRDIQREELARTAEQWWVAPPVPGTGQRGSDETQPEQLLDTELVTVTADARLDRLIPPAPWTEALTGWRRYEGPPPATWSWGFTKVERFARSALGWMSEEDDGDDAARQEARAAASALLARCRELMRVRRLTYRAIATADEDGELDPIERFVRSYTSISPKDLRSLDRAVEKMVDKLGAALGIAPAQAFERLAAYEVVTNATGIRTLAPPPFAFYRVCADRTVLGHEATEPEEKLAGMQLGHFAAFLKRSWRVNDWMWGRLDAIAWIGTMLKAEPEEVRRLQVAVLREELGALGREALEDERAGFSATCDVSLWRRRHATLLDRLERGGQVSDDELIDAFQRWKLSDAPELVMEEAGSRAGVLTATGLAAVASRALSGSASALPAPVRATFATTRQASALVNALAGTFARAPAVGVALVVVLAAFAVALASSDAALSAWLTPALVSLALVGAWTSYGWLSSPPAKWRALALSLLGGVLVYGALHQVRGAEHWNGTPPSWRPWAWPTGDAYAVLWWATEVAAVAVVALLVIYWFGVIVVPAAAVARAVRSALGIALVALLATYLVEVGLERATAESDGAWWERWLTDHDVVQGALIVGAVAGVLIPLLELLLRFGEGRRAP